MELALILGVAMVLALRALMVGGSGDGLADGGDAASGDESGTGDPLNVFQIAQGTFEIYTYTVVNSQCVRSEDPLAWVHSAIDTANPNAPYVEYWLMPEAVIVSGSDDSRLLFKPKDENAQFSPPANGTLKEVRADFITYAGVAGTWKMHVHHVANVI